MMFSFASLFLLGALSFAQSTTVSDPQNLLKKLDQYLGAQNFESVLSCGKKARFSMPTDRMEIGCENNGCWIMTEGMENREGMGEIHNCSADGASIYYDNAKIWDILKTDFSNANNNLGRLSLNQIGNFIDYPGELTVTSVELGKLTMSPNNVVEVMNIKGDYYVTSVDNSWPVIVSILKTDNGAAQMARLRFENITIFRLIGY